MSPHSPHSPQRLPAQPTQWWATALASQGRPATPTSQRWTSDLTKHSPASRRKSNKLSRIGFLDAEKKPEADAQSVLKDKLEDNQELVRQIVWQSRILHKSELLHSLVSTYLCALLPTGAMPIAPRRNCEVNGEMAIIITFGCFKGEPNCAFQVYYVERRDKLPSLYVSEWPIFQQHLDRCKTKESKLGSGLVFFKCVTFPPFRNA
eukprot:GHVN01071394.1.p1 GENE.GHVN01071394.1~~GHVN01071394.1.p1  ORF type:complete len:213 (+),score=15.45 GHVN01071394.1:24-641(+)